MTLIWLAAWLMAGTPHLGAGWLILLILFAYIDSVGWGRI